VKISQEKWLVGATPCSYQPQWLLSWAECHDRTDPAYS